MDTKVAFLRSINVGGRRVTGAELVRIFAAQGLRDVANFQASGNVVFSGEATATELADALQAALGYPVPVMVRTAVEVLALAEAAPFTDAERGASEGKVQVSLLAEPPTPAAIAAVRALETEADRLRFAHGALFWLPAGRMTDSALDQAALDRLLGMQTRRTQLTLERIAAKFLR